MSKTFTADEAKSAREDIGASQSEIANAIGVNRTYYSLFEAGRYILDEDEQTRLADALTARGYTTDDDANEQPIALPADPPVTLPNADPPSDEFTIARAKAQLSAIRQSVPRGLHSVRVARAVESATAALNSLDYIDVLKLATEAGLDTTGLITPDEFSNLALADMKAWENRAAGVLICSALYGEAWTSACFDQLKDAESELRGALDGVAIRYRELDFFESLFGDGNEHCPNRRADLAPYFVQAAIQRKAPLLAADTPNPTGAERDAS